MARHVRDRGGAGIKDKTIVADDLTDSSITTSKLNAAAVTTSKIGSVLSISGSVVKDGYLDYSPISTVKGATATLLHDVSGSAPYQHPYLRVASGSVQPKRGSPSGYFGVTVVGDR